MRKDIYERMKILKKDNIKPNYAQLAEKYNCDYRTVKRYFDSVDDSIELITHKRPSKLDNFKAIIYEKLMIPCSFKAIYGFIKDKGYTGKYSILRDYCKQIKDTERLKATIRFETNPGVQAQVDWKESMRLTSKYGEIFKIDIFLIILGYSRFKYFELTLDKKQDTLFSCLKNAFTFYGGVPKELLFDNMRTVVDQSRTQYLDAVINNSFYYFSKEMGFEVITCRAYRPSTKGKVEILAKLMDRLLVYNNEFESIEELDEIIMAFNSELNNEVCQAINQTPTARFEKE